MASKKTLEILAKQAKKELEAKKYVEKDKINKIVDLIFDDSKKEVSKVVHKKPKKEPIVWDVKKGDPVTYFDPDLSYEVTCYRPINETKGLDFDPSPFSETSRVYENTGNYTTFVPGFKQYRDFWTELFRRCNEGYTVNGYTITGDHYFFLNFYRLLKAVKDPTTGLEMRLEGFPLFCVEQYKWYHYVVLSEYVCKDVNALKPRGVGWSEMAAGMGLRMYTTKRRSKCIYTAASDSQLGPTMQKVWDQMEFLNTCTNGGMKHLRMVKNSLEVRRASRRLKDGTEVGFKSEIEAVLTDKPRKLRGDRVERLFFEESGSHPLLVLAYGESEALVTISGRKIGMRFTWGTGGDSGAQLAGLATIFYNPEAYNVLPYKNNYNLKHETVYTGFFIPAYSMVWQNMDNRGFCSEARGREYYDKMRLIKSKDPQALLIYKSEYCYYPEEALIREGSNRFDSEKIADQIANIELHKIVTPPTVGKLQWPLNKELGKADMNQIPKFTPTPEGKIYISEYPMTDLDGIPYNNLYVGGIDSIDGDKDSSSGQSDISNFCIVIKKRVFGLSEPKYVAIYKDRPKDVRTAYDNAIKLLQWYNCKAVVEATRVGIITYFKEKNKLNLLFKRPRATISNMQPRTNNQYGTPATSDIIDHQLELIDIFVQDYCHTINFLDMLQELLKYSYENKRKFDIVAAMGMAELADEDLYGKAPRSLQPYQKEWRDIGYYFENGIRKYGVIPKGYNESTAKIKNNQYDWIRKLYS